MVLHLTFGATHQADLYINPPSLGGAAPASPNITMTTTAPNFPFQRIGLYPGNGAGNGSFDEIRFGASFAAVTPILTATPDAPTDFSATPVSSIRIDLSWTDVAQTEFNYLLEHSNDQVNYTLVATLDYDTTSYSDDNLTPDTVYYYRLVARNSMGNSAYATVTTATLPPPPVPTPPTDLTATATSYNTIDLTWTDVADNETAYLVFRSADGVTFSQIDSIMADSQSYTAAHGRQ